MWTENRGSGSYAVRLVLVASITSNNMSMQAFLIRFFLIYVGLSAVARITLAFLSVEGSSAVNIGVLLGSVMWACRWVARRNKRYFTPAEKRYAILGMFVIDSTLQAVEVAVARATFYQTYR